jgi:hypothetical protein
MKISRQALGQQRWRCSSVRYTRGIGAHLTLRVVFIPIPAQLPQQTGEAGGRARRERLTAAITERSRR